MAVQQNPDMKILVADGQKDAADFLRSGLTEAGHVVTTTGTGTQALLIASEETFDAIILERLLPERDGLSVVRMLRALGTKTPVLFLTALCSVDDRVEGLESGADDYMAKPFALSEVVARLNALMRRPALAVVETSLHVADIELDLRRRLVSRAGRRIELQPREVLMLEELMRNSHRVMTKSDLLKRVWDFDFDPGTNLVETHISRLRSKLNAGFRHNAIMTVRGSGYIIRSKVL